MEESQTELGEETEHLIPTKKPKLGITVTLLFATFIFFLSSFQFGYGIGEMNSAQFFIPIYTTEMYNHSNTMYKINKNTHNKTCNNMNYFFKDCIIFDEYLESGVLDQWVWIVAIFSIGGFFGALLGGPLSDVFSRKWFLWGMAWVFIVGYLLQVVFSDFWAMLIGRMLQGFASGVSSGVAPMYLNEITPTRVRGTFGVFPQVGVVSGIFVSQTISIFTYTGQWWRVLLGWIILLPIIQLICLPFVPFSPRWLVKKGKFKMAEKALRFLRWKKDVSFEIDMMKASVQVDAGTGETRKMPVMKVIMHLICAVGLQICQQLSGINAVMFYSTQIFVDAKIPIPPDVVTSIVSFINAISIFPALFLIEKWGRKILLILGTSVQLISGIVLVVCLTVTHYWVNAIGDLIFGILAICSVLVYVLFFELGLGPIPWMIVGEIFTTRLRPIAYALATGMNWSLMVLVGLLFPLVQKNLQMFSFIPFIIVMILSIFFVIFFVKETKGKSIEEICYGKSKKYEKLKDAEKEEITINNSDKVEILSSDKLKEDEKVMEIQ